MFNLFSSEKRLWKSYQPLINGINQLESELINLSEIQLKEKTRRLQKIYLSENENSQDLIESFALVREASRRTLNLRHYDTQILAGLILNDNKIAEMRTGEGKTLVATAPGFHKALSGKGVHIITVNEYLAQRDAQWMGQIYRYLGLRVGLVLSEMESFEKRKNYYRDITYLTNSEVGFDYLRDNLVDEISDKVQRSLHYCILDEVDSILIDEARTPLVIAGPGDIKIIKIIKAYEVSKYLVEVQDYEVNRKFKSIHLTSRGFLKTQKLLRVSNMYDPKEPWIPFILNALKAKSLFFKNVDYLVQNNTIMIVDEFTGRILEGRRWAEGLHNAVEVKEKIYKDKGSETTASITYQSFFNLYSNMGGMTGTAKTEELEFETLYNLPVSVVPTYKPIKRIDLEDAVYIDKASKWKAIACECQNLHKIGRPVLVGTTTIENSENLASLLCEYKVPHELLNAKPENIKRESEIIAQAGCKFSVTIATNMAGRGTDVILGGNPEFKAYKKTVSYLKSVLQSPNQEQRKENLVLNQEFLKQGRILQSLEKDLETLLNLVNLPNKTLNNFEKAVFDIYQTFLKKCQFECKENKKEILHLGGLYVIGSERHESRRIDNQLRGRAGRQGDPGTTRFFLSLDDNLIRNFGGDRIKNFMVALQIPDKPLESGLLSKSLDSAQQKVEGFYYEQRKTLNKYDAIVDKQRSIVYNFRETILKSSKLRDFVLLFSAEVIEDFSFCLIKTKKEKTFVPSYLFYLFYSFNLAFEAGSSSKIENLEELKNFWLEQFWASHLLSELSFWFYDSDLFRKYEKSLVLKHIDEFWAMHLENITFLKDAVAWEAYAQKDPFIQYEQQVAKSFHNTFKQCKHLILYEILNSLPL